MNSPENARLALRRPQELVPQPEAGDSREAHCRPDDRPSSRDLAEERPSGTNLHQRGLLVDYDFSRGSQPRSPSRYFTCFTFSHLSVRPPT